MAAPAPLDGGDQYIAIVAVIGGAFVASVGSLGFVVWGLVMVVAGGLALAGYLSGRCRLARLAMATSYAAMVAYVGAKFIVDGGALWLLVVLVTVYWGVHYWRLGSFSNGDLLLPTEVGSSESVVALLEAPWALDRASLCAHISEAWGIEVSPESVGTGRGALHLNCDFGLVLVTCGDGPYPRVPADLLSGGFALPEAQQQAVRDHQGWLKVERIANPDEELLSGYGLDTIGLLVTQLAGDHCLGIGQPSAEVSSPWWFPQLLCELLPGRAVSSVLVHTELVHVYPPDFFAERETPPPAMISRATRQACVERFVRAFEADPEPAERYRVRLPLELGEYVIESWLEVEAIDGPVVRGRLAEVPAVPGVERSDKLEGLLEQAVELAIDGEPVR